MAGHSNQPRLVGRTRSRSIDRPSRSEISAANHNRTQAMETHFPATTSLPQRQSRRPRGRGRAAGTPSVPIAETTVESIFTTDPVTREPAINVEVHVYLHTPTIRDLRLIRSLAESFEMYLKANHLHYTYTLSPSMKIVEIAQRVLADMAASPS
ncbi:hypothetical protein B0H12DRAFT_233567 [Mycena haematopus]|nr:hypothetical protein B0H12DRAFT_233567 [Mycena haematopus]